MRRRLSIRFRQKKTPAVMLRGLPSLRWPGPGSAAQCEVRCAASGTRRYCRTSAADIGADDLAKAFPGLALELHELQLRERSEIGGAGVRLDAGQQTAEFKVLDARGLLHDVFTGEVVAAVLQHVDDALCDGVAVHQVAIDPVALGEILGEELVEGLHAGIILPLWIGGILEVGGRDDVLR